MNRVCTENKGERSVNRTYTFFYLFICSLRNSAFNSDCIDWNSFFNSVTNWQGCARKLSRRAWHSPGNWLRNWVWPRKLQSIQCTYRNSNRVPRK